MKKHLWILTALAGMASAAVAQEVVGAKIGQAQLERNANYMVVKMDIGLSGLQVESNRAVLLTPVVVHAADSVELPSIGIYGRNRYYHYIRNGASMLTGQHEKSFRASQKPDRVDYHEVIAYEPWMDGASLVLRRQDYGCCSEVLAEQNGTLASYAEPVVFRPEYVYVRPQGESMKVRSLSGSAYIDFVVNRTDIRPDYRRNRSELDKIQATIDSVRSDADITITAIAIKGYASPEGSYASNARLAKGRTESLRDYVQQLYHFHPSILSTDHEPEDWAGLEAYVEQSSLPHREEILAIVRSDADPDRKDADIRRRYPSDYRTLLAECYPALRHSDYRVEYIIRSYTDVAEIRRIYRENPKKLSLQEFYLLAQEYESGSEAFNEVYETAVRMYPGDALANLNAANAAMGRNDLSGAGRYLQQAGTSPEAVYARGVHAALCEDYPKALEYLQRAKSLGVKQAEAAIEVVSKMK